MSETVLQVVEGEVSKVAGEVKAEAVKIEQAVVAKVESAVVSFEGSIAAEIVKLKDALAALEAKFVSTSLGTELAALEAKVAAVIAKLGVNL